MMLKAAPILAIVLCLSTFGGERPLVASDIVDTREEVIEALRRTELRVGSMDDLSDSELSKVALRAKEVEAKRDIYARALQLYMERIGAGKDVDQALIDYEQAEISLAAELKNTRKVLAVINLQDHLAHQWKQRRTLKIERQTAENAVGHGRTAHAVRTADHQSMNYTLDAPDTSQKSSQGEVYF